jgi:hypothetical protein
MAGLLALAAPAPAQAKLLDIYAGPRVGMMQGWGQGLRGLGFGAEAGVELLLFDAVVNYTALLGGQRSGASMTELLLGMDGDFELDGAAGLYLRVGGAAGLGLLSPKAPPAMPGGGELTYKGLVLRGTVALERHLNRFVIIGLEFTGGYHYFLESQLIKQLSNGVPVVPGSAQDRWVQGGQFAGLLTLRAHFEPGS